MRRACVTLAAASLAGAMVQGPLQLAYCNATDPLQQLVVRASTVTSLDGTLCVTYVGASPLALAMAPCTPGAVTQAWTFDPTRWVFTGTPAGSSLAWNTQGGDEREG